MSECDLAVEIRKLLEQYNRATNRTCEVMVEWVNQMSISDSKPHMVLGAVRIVSEKFDRREAFA